MFEFVERLQCILNHAREWMPGLTRLGDMWYLLVPTYVMPILRVSLSEMSVPN